MSNLNIYFCGGAATNISKSIHDNADINMYCIDTSASNLKGVSNKENVYLVENVDGAGKLRTKSYESFNGLEEEVLIKFKPSKGLNLVVSSLSGGSGSIIAGILTKQLIKEGNNVIVVGIESKQSTIELENTIKTLKSYKGISDSTKKFLSVYYVDNKSRKEADLEVLRFITLASTLVDKSKTEEFDTADLHHFINPDKVTDNKYTVGMIEITPNEESHQTKDITVVSTVLLTNNPDSTLQGVRPEYLATCLVTDENYGNSDIRIDNVLGKLSIVINQLESELSDMKDNKRVNKHKDIEVSDTTDEGLVL